MQDKLLTVVETAAYLIAAKNVMSDNDRTSVVNAIAANPLCGDLIRGGGGIRKVRFAVGNRGKSGGVRVVYYYHNNDFPAYLLTVFAKNERSNLSDSEVKILAKSVSLLRKNFIN